MIKKNNIAKNLIIYLKVILNKNQKKTGINLLLIMVVGMLFEILLLNNLFTLLNYLSTASNELSTTINFFIQILEIKNIPVFILILFIIIFLIKTLVYIIIKWKEGKFLFNLLAEISKKLLHGYVSLPLIFHQKNNSSKILKNITIEIDQFSFIINAITTLTLETLILFGISAYLIILDPIVSTSCILSFIVFGYFFDLFNKKKIKIMGKDRLFHQDERIKSILECLKGLREIKTSGKENSFLKNFEFHNNSIKDITISQMLRINLSKPAFEIFLLLMLCFFLFYFISNNLLDEKIIPIFGVYLAAAYRLVPSISKIVQSLQNIQFNFACAENLHNEIQKFNDHEIKKSENNKFLKNNFNEIIEFKDVNFSYQSNQDKQNNILKDINFKIRKGEIVGISGESGSGKSTLMDLMLGLLTPTSGEILVDKTNINKFINNWYQLLGCVPQEVFVLDDTLKKNIAFGVPEKEISDKQILKCLTMSNLNDFAESLEKKINTKIGEGGAKISGGQKQRIGIARAFYNDPEILIFDESTNSLDIETENKILSEIYKFKKNKTIFIISHNENILKDCDYILNLQNKSLNKIIKRKIK